MVMRTIILLSTVFALTSCTALENNRKSWLDRDAIPDLENGGDLTRGLAINTLFVNRSGVTGLQEDTYLTLEDVEDLDPAFRAEQAQNIRELNGAGAKPFNPNQRVEIRFDDDPLTLVVEQLLGGLLSANYVADTPLSGSVIFETRAPVLRSEVPTILRDILGAQGYVMKLINGVYHIGAPETIEQLELNAAVGASSEFESRVIRVGRSNLDDISTVVSQILPRGASVTSVPNEGTLIVSASPADINAVVNLVNTLVDTGATKDLVTIVTLKRSAPESVAAGLLSYYEQRNTPRSSIPIVIPLENQQSLLLGARDARTMNNARKLVRGLDRDLRDTASLRIIPMTHLPAAEIAAQLNEIYGFGAPNVKLDQPQAEEVVTSVLAPANIRSENAAENAPSEAEFAKAANSSPAGVSIVPDGRNNALLVYSTFDQFKRIREVVTALDLPLAQVVIEATIVEVTLNNNLSFGVQAFLNKNGTILRSARTQAPTDSNLAGFFGQFTSSIGGFTVDVVLEALESVTDVRIISSPYLTVLDGSSARLSIGDEIPFLTSSTDAESDGTVTTTNEIEIRETGVILDVTPSIGADNAVILNIVQEVSSVAPGGGETIDLTPVIRQRRITSEIVVQSGRTALLGGLIQDSQTDVKTRVPVVSNIPVVGELFKQTQNDIARNELLVMITPRVVRKPSQLDNITRQLREKLRQ